MRGATRDPPWPTAPMQQHARLPTRHEGRQRIAHSRARRRYACARRSSRVRHASTARHTTLSTPVHSVAWGRPGPSAAPSRRSTPQACAGRPARRRGAPCSAAARIGSGNALPTHGATNPAMAGTGAHKRRGARKGTRARHPHATASGGMARCPGGTQRARRVRGAQARGTRVLTPYSHRTRGRGGFAVRWESAPPPNRLRISSEAAGSRAAIATIATIATVQPKTKQKHASEDRLCVRARRIARAPVSCMHGCVRVCACACLCLCACV